MPLAAKIILCILVSVLLGGSGGIVTASSIGGWYRTIEPPPGTPPNWVFGPVWTFLYAAMGTAFALVWHRAPAGRPKRHALTLFGIQFALNLAWSPVFFGLHRIDLALAIIVTLLAAILMTARRFRPLDPPAAALLVPYALWVGYATYLNAGFLMLNR
jgi:tryptophan-rich sensory protein